MPICPKSLAGRIRKLQKLRTLLTDEDTRELIADPEVMALLRNGTGNNGSVTSSGRGSMTPSYGGEVDDTNLPPEGSLIRAVLDTARGCPGKFDVNYIFNKLTAEGYTFEAKLRKPSINTSLMRLIDRNLVRLVRKGSGRIANIFEAVRKEGTK